jgi:hypothetical protein
MVILYGLTRSEYRVPITIQRVDRGLIYIDGMPSRQASYPNTDDDSTLVPKVTAGGRCYRNSDVSSKDAL